MQLPTRKRREPESHLGVEHVCPERPRPTHCLHRPPNEIPYVPSAQSTIVVLVELILDIARARIQVVILIEKPNARVDNQLRTINVTLTQLKTKQDARVIVLTLRVTFVFAPPLTRKARPAAL